MTGRVSVLVVAGDGTSTLWTARDPGVSWDEGGFLGIVGEAWHRAVHPAPTDLPDTAPCGGCGLAIDRTRPHVTVARHLEVTRPDGTDVLEATPVAQYHRACEPGGHHG